LVLTIVAGVYAYLRFGPPDEDAGAAHVAAPIAPPPSPPPAVHPDAAEPAIAAAPVVTASVGSASVAVAEDLEEEDLEAVGDSTSAAELEPEEEVEEHPAERPSAKTSAVVSAPKRPAPRPAAPRIAPAPPSIPALSGRLDATLRNRGLSWDDLKSNGRLARLVTRWERAKQSNNLKDATTHAAALTDQIERLRIDDPLVRRKLDRLGRGISGAKRSPAAARRVSDLETRYKALRDFVGKRRLSESDRRAALYAAAKLERELARIVGRGS
jgi:hypothetical protein